MCLKNLIVNIIIKYIVCAVEYLHRDRVVLGANSLKAESYQRGTKIVLIVALCDSDAQHIKSLSIGNKANASVAS